MKPNLCLHKKHVETLHLSKPPPSAGNSVRVERAKAVRQRCIAASQELVPVRGHRSVAEGRGWRRSLRGRAAHLSHLLFLEEKQEVRRTCQLDLSKHTH